MSHPFKAILSLLIIALFAAPGSLFAEKPSEPKKEDDPGYIPSLDVSPDEYRRRRDAHHERLRAAVEERRQNRQEVNLPLVDPEIRKYNTVVNFSQEFETMDHLAEKITEATGLRAVIFAPAGHQMTETVRGEQNLQQALARMAMETGCVWRLVEDRFLWLAPQEIKAPVFQTQLEYHDSFPTVTIDAFNAPMWEVFHYLTFENNQQYIYNVEHERAIHVPITLRTEELATEEFHRILQLRYEFDGRLGYVLVPLIYVTIPATGTGKAWNVQYSEEVPLPPVLKPLPGKEKVSVAETGE